VIGIIGILVSLLMPALARVRQHANSVKCQSNLYQIGAALQMYSNEYRGWLYPVGPKDPITGVPRTLGWSRGCRREQRWPSLVFDPHVWNPPFMLCPSDFEPAEEHSYLLNKHLADRGVRFGRSRVGQLDSTQVVVMGEKVSSQGDYYMSRGQRLRAQRILPRRRALPPRGQARVQLPLPRHAREHRPAERRRPRRRTRGTWEWA
jgi:type II secretory pathway pseudopilin PulG